MLGSSSDVPVSPSALRRTRDILERLIIPESGVISSSRELSVLGHDFPQALARYFDPFVGIDSATDHLPLGFVRVEWATQAFYSRMPKFSVASSSIDQTL